MLKSYELIKKSLLLQQQQCVVVVETCCIIYNTLVMGVGDNSIAVDRRVFLVLLVGGTTCRRAQVESSYGRD